LESEAPKPANWLNRVIQALGFSEPADDAGSGDIYGQAETPANCGRPLGGRFYFKGLVGKIFAEYELLVNVK